MSRVKSRLSFLSVGAMFSFDIQDVLVERIKSSFQVFKSNWVFEKDVASKYTLRLPQLEYTRFPRAANEPPRATLCGVSSRPLGLRLLAPPKTFPPAGVSRIPVAGLGFHSQRVALTIQFIQS